MERSDIRVGRAKSPAASLWSGPIPDFTALNPGYACCCAVDS